MKKGGQVTSELWKKISATVERCNLLSSPNQAKFLNHVIVEEYEMGPAGDKKAISSYMGHLIKLTQEVDTVGVVQITRVIKPPE